MGDLEGKRMTLFHGASWYGFSWCFFVWVHFEIGFGVCPTNWLDVGINPDSFHDCNHLSGEVMTSCPKLNPLNFVVQEVVLLPSFVSLHGWDQSSL